jgi:hypothetical protein
MMASEANSAASTKALLGQPLIMFFIHGYRLLILIKQVRRPPNNIAARFDEPSRICQSVYNYKFRFRRRIGRHPIGEDWKNEAVGFSPISVTTGFSGQLMRSK